MPLCFPGTLSQLEYIFAALKPGSELFFTDDEGTYIFPTCDFHPEIEIQDGKLDLEEFLLAHKKRIRKLSNNRLHIPRWEPV
jgi:hypothetical protein